MKKMKVACIQINAGKDWRQNLKKSQIFLKQAARRGAQLVVFPENFCYRGNAENLDELANFVTPQVLQSFQNEAKKHRLVLLLGSLIERSPQPKKFYNASFLISEKGKILARYRKIHLFDVQLKKMKIQESAHICPGKKSVISKVLGVSCGLTICYDLRFPELFRQLAFRGARMIFVPSNFTEKTGRAHWEVLLRARAIENQVFILAPGQCGVNSDTQICSFGNSLIIDPWGKILGKAGLDREGIVIAELDFKSQRDIRRGLPALAHVRLGIRSAPNSRL